MTHDCPTSTPSEKHALGAPDSVPTECAGTASGVLNTSRQVGGAVAIAVYGALLANLGFLDGLRTSLLIAGLLLLATTLASLTLRPASQH